MIRFIFFFTILTPAVLFSQNEQDLWWTPRYQEGIALMDSARYSEAERRFLEILDKNSKIAEAHYGLGMLYHRIEPGSEKAIKALKQAAKLKTGYTMAHYQLALVCLTALDNRDEAMENLRKATDIDSSYLPGWYKLAEILIDIDDPKATLRSLSKEISRNRAFIEPCVAYIQDSLRVRFPDASTTQLSSLSAKMLFILDRSVLGLEHYWSALAATRDSMDANLFLNDLSYIMSDAEYDRLAETPIDSLNDFYRHFWLKRDPDLATEENERISEHYSRLVYVYEHYPRRAQAVQDAIRNHRRWHPVNRFYPVREDMMGDSLLHRIGFSAAIPKDRPYDDAALIYIRHGKPDQVATSVVNSVDYGELPMELSRFFRAHFEDGMTNYDQLRERYLGYDIQPQNLSWRYQPIASRPELIFHFFRYGGQSGWIIEAIPSSFMNRENWRPDYYRMKQSLIAAEFAEIGRSIVEEHYTGSGAEAINFDAIYGENIMKIPELAVEVENDEIAYLKTGFTTETSDLEYDSEPLDFRYRIVTFKGNEGKNWVEVYYAIQGDRTRLAGSGSDTKLLLEQSFVFTPENSDDIVRIQRENETAVGLTQEDWNRKGILAVEIIPMNPGIYDYEIQFRDVTAGKLGVYKGTYQNTDFNSPDPTLSDVLLIGDIRAAEGEEVFVKGDIAFVPKFFSDYARGEKIGVYFEIYNLTFDASGGTEYKINCRLQKGDGKGLFKKILGVFGGDDESISSEYLYKGSERDERVHLTLDLAGRPAGEYEILIRVEDLNAGRVVESKVPVTVK
jgi:tetratricopeptide (TPR) repeat protein